MKIEELVQRGFGIEKINNEYLVIIKIPYKYRMQRDKLEAYLRKYENIYVDKLYYFDSQLLEAVMSNYELQNQSIVKDIEEPARIIDAILKDKYDIQIDNIEYKTNKTEHYIEGIIRTNIPEALYAFYIKKDSKKIHFKEYSIENFVNYPIHQDGDYEVVFFIKTRIGKRSFVLSVPKRIGNTILEHDITRIKRIYIHGSCVSRDILNFGDKNKMQLTGYTARQSIFSSFTPPLKQIESFQPKLTSKFQIKMLRRDCEKKLWEDMKEHMGDYLIIDLVDTVRFCMYKIDKTLVTGSSELLESGFLDTISAERIVISELKNEWEIYIEKYVKELKKYYKEEQIVLHLAYYKYFYKDIKGKIRLFPKKKLVKYKEINQQLKEMYKLLIKYLPKAHVINLCQGRKSLADANHHFGLSPVHYIEEYYLAVQKRIEELDNVL